MDSRGVGAPERRTGWRKVKRAVQLFDVALLGFCFASGAVLIVVKLLPRLVGA